MANDRISEILNQLNEMLLSEDFGSQIPESLMGRELPNTEPTQHPLLELLTNQQGQDDFLMMMAGLPKQPAKGAINVGMQRFMLDPDWVARTGLTRAGEKEATELSKYFIPPLTNIGRKIAGPSNIPRTASREDFIPPLTNIGRKIAGPSIKRQETINQAYQTANPTPNLATLYQKALDQLQKAKELARDTIGMRNPTGQIRQADAMEAAALREIERIRKLGNGKLPNLMPDTLTTEQIQQAMLDAGLGSLTKDQTGRMVFGPLTDIGRKINPK